MAKKFERQLAFDRATVRTIDANGRMRVEISNISKAAVNPYYGWEIPGAEELGLDPETVYMLLRDPKELEKAAATFNNIPLLSKHQPVFAHDHASELVVGATGTDAVFEEPYLKNSLIVWKADAIAGINTEEQKELSCAYGYVPVMTPGTYMGEPYDGIMTEIVGNHVALVPAGRAGSDVVVQDSNPFFNSEIFNMKASRKAIAVRAALGVFLRPLLAQDAAIGDLGALVRDVKPKSQDADIKRIVKDTIVKFKGKLAADMQMQPEELTTILKSAADEVEEEEVLNAMDDRLDGETDEEYEARKKKQAEDEEAEREKKEGEGKQAMDAAISKAVKNAEKNTMARMLAIRQAEKDVHPFVGEVAAMDSAESIYKLALDAAEVDLTDVPPSAYRAMVSMLPKPGTKKDPVVAQDSASSAADFKAMFPTAVIPARG